MNFAKFLRTSFFIEHLWWLLLLDYHYFKSSSVKIPNHFFDLGYCGQNQSQLWLARAYSQDLLEFKVGNALNLLCVIVVRSLALILLVIENDLSGVAVVAPLTNVITMVTTFFIKSLSLVERALRFDKIINWAVFLSVQIVCEWSISSPKIARKLSNSWWYSFPLIDSSNNYSCLRID